MRVTTGSPLDELLQGGLETDAITTIYGPPGTGKTTFAMHAAVEMAKKGKKVVYVDTEGGFSIERLKQVCKDHKKILTHILFLRPTSFEEQNNAIMQLAKMRNAELIIVDTIGMLYRMDRKNADLNEQIHLLNTISRTKEIPVLLTNQVYKDFSTGINEMIGGETIRYGSKCLIELKADRTATLHKHRSLAPIKINYKITAIGITN